MCGITGFSYNNKNLVEKMGLRLKHRGPDASGYWSDDFISFSQQRLSIIDLSSGGSQPMFYSREKGCCSSDFYPERIEASEIGIVFNGEIYNYIELRNDLKLQGYIFTSQSDTEVVLAAYLAYGTSFVQKLNGMWAFCIYDKSKKTMFLSRDRMGIKPLYYHKSLTNLVFGSELKVFFEYGIPKQINHKSIEHYLLFNYTPADETAIQGIKKLKAGHNLVYDLNTRQIINYENFWEIRFEKQNLNKTEHITKIRETLELAIKRRVLAADVPVGAFLSGGLDSSIIVSIMRKYVENLNTFSIRFDYEQFNESIWANKVAGLLQTKHHEIEFSAKDVEKLMDELPFYFDDVFADASMIPTYLVSKVASQHVKVCLSGTGGDELFAGYHRHREMTNLNRLFRLPTLIGSLTSKAYQQINKDKGQKLSQLLDSNSNTEVYLKLFSHLFRSDNEPHPDLKVWLEMYSFSKDKSLLNNVLNFDQTSYLTDCLLVKEDRATMANSLEGRIPFIDFEMVQLANSIPSSLKLKNGIGKYILKEAYTHILPNEILHRRKQGFGVPLVEYFRNELKDFAYDRLFNYTKTDTYDTSKLIKLWDQHQKKKSDYSALFYNLIMLNRWHQTWINS